MSCYYTSVEKLSKKIVKLLKKYPNLTVNEEKNKIKCTLTGHEMQCKEDAINSYIQGKKFKKAFARDSGNYEKYKPHIVPSTKKFHENHLFCMLTLRHINKTPQHVERHVNGKRYKKALARWKVCQEKGTKFVPNRRKRDKSEQADSTEDDKDTEADNGIVDPTSGDDEDDQSDEDDDDDMEDLYPEEDFKAEEEEEGKMDANNEDSDYEFEDENFNTDTGSIPVVKSQVKETKIKRKEKTCKMCTSKEACTLEWRSRPTTASETQLLNKDAKPSKKKKQKVG